MENKITVEFDVPDGYVFDRLDYPMQGDFYLSPCSNFEPTLWEMDYVSGLKSVIIKKVASKRRVFEKVTGATKAYPGNFWAVDSGDMYYNNTQAPVDSNEVYKEVFDD